MASVLSHEPEKTLHSCLEGTIVRTENLRGIKPQVEVNNTQNPNALSHLEFAMFEGKILWLIPLDAVGFTRARAAMLQKGCPKLNWTSLDISTAG